LLISVVFAIDIWMRGDRPATVRDP